MVLLFGLLRGSYVPRVSVQVRGDALTYATSESQVTWY